MPRSIWNGALAFGLVTVPVKVYSATESKTVRFREVHAKDGSTVEHRRICPREDKAVPHKEIVKGFEVSKGKWVELTDDEIAAAAGPRSRRVDVEHFVPAAEVDPTYYEKTYYLGASDKGRDAFALLYAALERSGRAGVGRWVFHNRERTVVVRPCEPILAMHTMRFTDELADLSGFELGRVQRKPSSQEVKMATALVEGLETRFDPDDYEDAYRNAVLAVVERKAAGKNIEPPAEEPSDGSGDLLAALEASLKGS
jgi:DNA end-binding protein Ku